MTHFLKCGQTTIFHLKMKQKQLRELFSIGLSVSLNEMKTLKVENRR